MKVLSRFEIRRFLFFFARSVSQRKGRVVIASLSVMLAVAMVTALAGINSGIREKLGAELKAYGANIIVSPRNGDSIEAAALDKIRGIQHVEDASGQVLGKVFIGGYAIELIGLNIDRLKYSGWRFIGDRPAKRNEVLAGIDLRDALRLAPGKTLSLESNGGKADFIVSGFVEKGGPEDSSIIMSIEDAWELTGTNNVFSAILVRGEPGKLDGIARDIVRDVPAVAAKTLRQVASAEESLLSKMQLLMTLVTLIALFASTVSVASTVSANVFERKKEIGLMKALGGSRSQITLFYTTEAVIIGLSGGLSGFIAGYLSAQAISRGAFGSFIHLPQWMILLSLAMGLSIALTASHFPVRGAMRYDAAAILRGE